MTRVKICGITNLDDALMAVQAGADALGFVFHKRSPRCITPEAAAAVIREIPPFVQTVGLFVNEEVEYVNETSDLCRLDLVQLHGDEAPGYCGLVRRRVIKAFRVKDMESLGPIGNYRVTGYLLDAFSPKAYGGTGVAFNWEIAKVAREQFSPIILAGGLTPENVAQAVKAVDPFAVDVSSGVESLPGRKDRDKVASFIRLAKGRK
ncbi:phosphoribosylanthranilate isomerase [Geobacter sp. DSM 9736]|uniref:phosphoribosylanthranilate isomerase n=1 Tax=Geobacter sp. DSM 9736 TaxID=1277350 RepID=UPI000B500E56|nr:phosphoribosylanthranilate isomerase [Geobacter sp. DSM 9736]SNB44647.1 phosphoribosylanthranilate isomerase [Geobacter sp. DSM 9736]